MENALYSSLLSLVRVPPPIAGSQNVSWRQNTWVRTSWEAKKARARRLFWLFHPKVFYRNVRRILPLIFTAASKIWIFHVDFKGYFWRLLMCLWEAEAWWNGEWEGTATAVLSSKWNWKSVHYLFVQVASWLYKINKNNYTSCKIHIECYLFDILTSFAGIMLNIEPWKCKTQFCWLVMNLVKCLNWIM